MNSIERILEDSRGNCYKTTCACHSDDHNITIWFDKEDDDFMSLYFNVVGPHPYTWKGSSWRERIWHRIYGAARILFTGQITYQDAFLFRNKKHVEDFIAALKEGMGQE
jgi:hypothetical protein